MSIKSDKRFLIPPIVNDEIIAKRRDISANGELNLSCKLRACRRALSFWKKKAIQCQIYDSSVGEKFGVFSIPKLLV